MGRQHKNLKYQLCQAGLSGLDNNRTVTGYKRYLKRFAVWCRENTKVKDISEITAEVVQEYEKTLEADPKNYTPASIHKILAPVCRAVSVPMDKISKPKRRSGTIVRGRSEEANRQGKHQAEEPRFSRLVSFQKAVGIRRSELARLTGKDLCGNYIHVTKGKGGKEQFQFILPEDRETVRAVFAGIGPDQRVFTRDEMNNVIDLHSMRASHARRCYSYYLQMLENHPERIASMRKTLLDRWEGAHERMKSQNPKAWQRQRDKFISNMRDKPYKLRGDNRARAISTERPTEYNRLAIMCVSVFHLSHWRTDVTVTNYML